MPKPFNKASTKQSQNGSAHEILFVAVIVTGIIGVLGFVGYNQWQKSENNIADAATASVSVKAATYNILGQHHDPKYPTNKWADRKSRVSAKISEYKPSIIGLQEVTYMNPITGGTSPQRYDVVRFMKDKGYAAYYGSNYNNSPIFWKNSEFRVLAKKEVQIVKQDMRAQGPAARFLTYVRLSKGGKNISVFNYHFNQFRNISAQYDALKKYYTSLKVRGDHVIWTGDFNGYEDDIRNRIAGLYRVDSSSSVDHILASNTPTVARNSWTQLANTKPFASDHRLVGVSVVLR